MSVTSTLYHTKWYTSSVPFNVAHELSIPATKFAIKTITEDEMRNGEEYVKLSPRRLNPVLVLPDGSSILETGAVTMYLLERFDADGKLHPLIGDPMRPKFHQGMFYAATEGFKASFELFRQYCSRTPASEKSPEKAAELKKKFKEVVLDHLEKELDNGQKQFYLGDKFSAVDIMFAYICMCAEYCCEDALDREVLKPYFDSLKAREAYGLAYTPTEEEKAESEKMKQNA